MSRYKDALESMVWQFGYRITHKGKIALSTGGLSALEEAFSVLGWDDPHLVDEPSMECDVEGCHNWYGPQMNWGGFYSHICSEHYASWTVGEDRPPMKQSAIDREARRDKDGILRD